MKMFQLLLLTLCMAFSLNAMAGEVNLDGGESITIQANTTTTITCSGGSSGENHVVAKVCVCEHEGLGIAAYYALKMRLIYTDGSKKDVNLGGIYNEKRDCEKVAKDSCN